jgi:hypothetical protein
VPGSTRACPFSAALRGDVPLERDVVLTGVMDTTGINFNSLIGPSAAFGTTQCVALILTASDQSRARRLHGHSVAVRGGVMFLADIERMIPDDLGTVNGRDWTGTPCEGEIALFVRRLDAAPQAEE